MVVNETMTVCWWLSEYQAQRKMALRKKEHFWHKFQIRV